MGACRVLVYALASLALAGEVSQGVRGGALSLFAYLIGLTYAGKQETLTRFENFWPLLFLLFPFAYVPYAYGVGRLAGDFATLSIYVALLGWVGFSLSLLVRRAPGNIPRAVVSLIAGISLLDALLIAAAGAPGLAVLAALSFALTLMLRSATCAGLDR